MLLIVAISITGWNLGNMNFMRRWDVVFDDASVWVNNLSWFRDVLTLAFIRRGALVLAVSRNCDVLVSGVLWFRLVLSRLRIVINNDNCLVLLSKSVPGSWVSRCIFTNNLRTKVPDFVGKTNLILIVFQQYIESSQERHSEDDVVLFRVWHDMDHANLDVLLEGSGPEDLWNSELGTVHVNGEVSKVVVMAWLVAFDAVIDNFELRIDLFQCLMELIEIVYRQVDLVRGSSQLDGLLHAREVILEEGLLFPL